MEIFFAQISINGFNFDESLMYFMWRRFSRGFNNSSFFCLFGTRTPKVFVPCLFNVLCAIFLHVGCFVSRLSRPGGTFDRESVTEWLQSHTTCPVGAPRPPMMTPTENSPFSPPNDKAFVKQHDNKNYYYFYPVFFNVLTHKSKCFNVKLLFASTGLAPGEGARFYISFMIVRGKQQTNTGSTVPINNTQPAIMYLAPAHHSIKEQKFFRVTSQQWIWNYFRTIFLKRERLGFRYTPVIEPKMACSVCPVIFLGLHGIWNIWISQPKCFYL